MVGSSVVHSDVVSVGGHVPVDKSVVVGAVVLLPSSVLGHSDVDGSSVLVIGPYIITIIIHRHFHNKKHNIKIKRSTQQVEVSS